MFRQVKYLIYEFKSKHYIANTNTLINKLEVIDIDAYIILLICVEVKSIADNLDHGLAQFMAASMQKSHYL